MSKKNNYDVLVDGIISKVGGKDNVVSLYHCVTRLRFKLKDDTLVKKDELKKLDGVLSLVEAGGVFQVVIGNNVDKVYKVIDEKYHFANPTQDDGFQGSDTKEEGNMLARGLSKLGSIFQPALPALAGAGMLKAVIIILTTIGLISDTSSTYKILAAAGNGVFYFLPFFLAFSSARTFKCNPYIALAIVAALLEPNFTGLMENTGDVVSFFGIPVTLMGYTSTIIPAVLSIFAYSKLEIILKKVIPDNLDLFLTPLFALIIMVPLTMIVIGPVGVFLGNTLGDFMNWLSGTSGIFAGAFIGGGWMFLTMLGIHWGVVPIMLNNLAQTGTDIIRPMISAANFACAGAAFGSALRIKDKNNKALAFSTVFPMLFGGVTEPIIYGVLLRYKRPIFAQLTGGIIGGAFMGALGVEVYAYAFPALTTLPAFFGRTFTLYCIGIAISFGLAAVMAFILGVVEDEVQEVDLTSCIEGTTIPLSEVNDPVFSTKSMGDGVAIIPSDGKLYAPISGSVNVLFPSGHAVGIKGDNGVEVLMHIGLDSVNVGSGFFQPKIKQGDRVKKGQLLVEFDLDQLKAKGVDPTTIMVITNMNEIESLNHLQVDVANNKDTLLHIVMKGA